MIIELRPIKESTEDYEAVEFRIKELFKRLIYFPLLRELKEPKRVLTNSRDRLLDAIASGQITFSQGKFEGRFNSAISKELRGLGARFDRKTRTYRVRQSSLPAGIKAAISTSEVRFQEKLERIDRKLAQILPGDLARELKVETLFDRTLWKTEKDFQASVRGITIAPKLTREASQRIASEWQTNMQLWIQDFTEKEIIELRTKIKKATFAGDRYGSTVKSIQDSYGVSANKAKFLAHQETSLLMAKFKQTRCQDAGANGYKWNCVAGSKAHPVRPRHKALADASKAGKIFEWDNPPVTTEPGQPERRNNPGQDYNCRCFARPVIYFRGK